MKEYSNRRMNIISSICYKMYYENDYINKSYFDKDNIRFILNNGFKQNNIDSHLINTLVILNNNKNKELEFIFKYYTYNNSVILKFLFSYNRKISMTNKEICSLVIQLKKIVEIDESVYIYVMNRGHYHALNILFTYDSSSKEVMLKKIYELKLIKVALQHNRKDFLENLLNYEAFDIKTLEFENIIIEGIYNRYSADILKNFINQLKENHYNFETVNFENILLEINKNFCKSNLVILKVIIGLLIKINLNDKNEKTLEISDNLKKYDNSFPILLLNSVIKIDNLELVKLLMKHKELRLTENLNTKDKNDEYPIFSSYHALRYYSKQPSFNCYQIFEYLLKQGAKVDVKDVYNNSLICLALSEYEFMILRYIFKYASLVNNENTKQRNRQIMQAVYKDDVNLFKNLYYSTSNMDKLINSIICKNKFNIITLSYLINSRNVLNYLLNEKTIQFYDYNKYYLIQYAILKEDISMIKRLIELGNENYFDSIKHLLNISIEISNKEIFNILLDCDNINFNEYNKYSETPMMALIKSPYFSMEDKKEMINKFYKKKKEQGLTEFPISRMFLLKRAIKENQIPIVKLLINNGADIEVTFSEDVSPLHYAIYFGKVSMIKALLNYGANVNKKDNDSKTPIIYAFENINEDSLSIIKLLIEYGANVNIIDNESKTPLKYAIIYNSFPIVKLLIENGSDINFNSRNRIEDDILYLAIKYKNLDIIEYIIKNHFNIKPEFKNEYYEYINQLDHPLMKKKIFKWLAKYTNEFFTGNIINTIIREGHIDLIKCLIKNNININIGDENGHTPLFFSYLFNESEITKVLINGGAVLSNKEKYSNIFNNRKKYDDLINNRIKRIKISK
ncbi:ankyrin repeat-containing domain protein [Neocallimastix lanati (nom. inval.)]|nr:ankyrin repeat-containing domain protein [Neocallimastix sp. JGI-2020a]